MKTAVTVADAADLDPDDIFDLSAAYEEVLATTKRDDRQGHFHPSAVGRCARANVYEYMRAPKLEGIEPKSLEIFDLGHAIHDVVGRRLENLDRALRPKNIGFQIQREAPYDPATDALFADFGLGGTSDILLEIWADTWRQRSTVEVKSINADQFEKLRAPKPWHLQQAHIYAYRFNTPIIYVWYYCKNNSERKVYPVVFSQKILDGALQRFESQLAFAESGTLPDREESYWDCPRCEYREQCKPSVLNKINGKNTSVAKNKAISALRKRGKL